MLNNFGLVPGYEGGGYPPPGRVPSDREYEVIRPVIHNGVIYTPITNSHKKDIAQLYTHYGIQDTLYPLTRSCESYNMDVTKNMTKHCGECYPCIERFWGFGKYE